MQYTTRRIFIDDDEERQEQIIRPKNISHLIKNISILCLTTFYFGYSFVYISSLSSQTLIEVFGGDLATPLVKGFLIGSLTLGAMLGSAISIPLIPLFTRRNLTLSICVFAVILEIVIQYPNLIPLFICRTLQGVCSGLFMALVPVYIEQLVPKQVAKKGIFGVFSTLFVIIGVMTAFSLNIVLIISGLASYIRWRVIFIINFVAILIVIISILTDRIPQSPNSLIENGQQKKAREVIGMYHKKRFVDQVYRQRERDVLQKKQKLKEKFINQRVSLRRFLAFEMPIMQQLTGINAFVSQMGFVVTAYNNSFGQFVPVIMGIVQFIAAAYSMTCLGKAKRRSMILTGNIGMGICSLCIGILFIYIDEFNDGFWIVVFLTFVYMTIHGGTLIPAVWMYVGQVVKDDTPLYSSITNWFMCSVTIVIFPIINQNYGYAPMFLTFGVISLLLSIYNCIFMFETQQVKRKDSKDYQLQSS